MSHPMNEIARNTPTLAFEQSVKLPLNNGPNNNKQLTNNKLLNHEPNNNKHPSNNKSLNTHNTMAKIK